jgi:hypothetical protein
MCRVDTGPRFPTIRIGLKPSQAILLQLPYWKHRFCVTNATLSKKCEQYSQLFIVISIHYPGPTQISNLPPHSPGHHQARAFPHHQD